MKNIIRHHYMDALTQVQDTNVIKLISGIRGCGKSTIFLQYQQLLRARQREIAILSFDFDIPEYRFLTNKNWIEIYVFIKLSLNPNTMNYVFLDEIQHIVNYEKLLDALMGHKNIDLYASSSNMFLISSDLMPHFSGRVVEINVLPFSFKEYIAYTEGQLTPEKSFVDYVQIGGFPEASKLAMAGRSYSFEYLQTVFRNIYQDYLDKKYNVYLEESYQNVVNFLIDSIGSPVSSANIAKVITREKKNIDHKTVSRYINTLVESFLIYKLNRYNIKEKSLLATLEKYYLVDTGFYWTLSNIKEINNNEKLLENIVFLELVRRGYKVMIGKINKLEVDFVTHDPKGEIQYIQMAQTLKNPETEQMVILPFDKIPDHYEKIIISMDDKPQSKNGIKHINAIEWLLGGK